MQRQLGCLFAAMLCLGCQAPNGVVDPLVGRQTVPPPGTGTPAAVPPGKEYYSTPNGNAANPPNSGGGLYTPPGGNYGYGSNNNSVTNNSNPANGNFRAGGTAVQSANPNERPPATASRSSPNSSFQVNSNPARGLPQATTASTRGMGGVPTPASREPGRFTPSRSGTDMNPPDSRGDTRPPSRDSGGFRPPGTTTRASFEEDASEPPPTGATRTSRRETISPSGKYDLDRDYRWLKGKLEYSRVEDRWKLRYIPIDGDTDEYGGSVVLLGSRMLEGYKPGEYVTVHGSLGESDSRGGFAPAYKVDRVTRQGDE